MRWSVNIYVERSKKPGAHPLVRAPVRPGVGRRRPGQLLAGALVHELEHPDHRPGAARGADDDGQPVPMQPARLGGALLAAPAFGQHCRGADFCTGERARPAGHQLGCAAACAVCLASTFYYAPWSLAGVAAGFMALLVRVIKNCFEQAVRMKDELDYTI